MTKEGWKVLDEVSFSIPSLPPSVNAIYQIIFHQRRVEMKPDVRLWKTQAKEYVPRIEAKDETEFFMIDAVFCYPFFYKNGKVKKLDTQNLLKVMIDAIAEKVGFNDTLVKFGSWQSYHDEDERVYVTVKQIKLAQEETSHSKRPTP